MNDWKLAVNVIRDAISEARKDLDLAAKLGLYAGVRVLLADIEQHIEDTIGEDSYASEKIGQVQWFLGAALGFDVDNGHTAESHRSFALGSLNSLENALSDSLSS